MVKSLETVLLIFPDRVASIFYRIYANSCKHLFKSFEKNSFLVSKYKKIVT